MDTIEKLKILSEDSRYDMACACGSSDDDRRKRGLDGKWLYPVTLPNGGYSILLKTLLSNACSNDCKYCPIRSDANLPRCTLKPEETANLFMDYVKKKKVFGLFLSSGIINNPDYIMDKINAVSRLLRYKHGYKGYIHLKIIPGASDAAIEDTLALASAVSLNIETPGKERFDLLSNKKNYINDIIRPIKLISKLTSEGGRFSRVKSTTQFIVGASNETDSEIIKYMLGLYKKLNFQRVYFSAYQKGLGHHTIPGEQKTDSTPEQTFMREHRLYQVDYLIRKYGFSGEDIILDKSGNLELDKDPKEIWADRHTEFYPVRINKADKRTLLRVPGLGPATVDIILKTRLRGSIAHFEDLGIKGKRLENVKKHAIIA
ncbi:MAG: radical SAM protein [Deltaproteobacteria bacterium]|jgi:predicted DNA-binding helix-hairpin-helix protein|nr:radical SAM protein [Deltaproteobacteria bacterium]MCL5879216.1 radical SAM protein [Deltaproteobacteria bacterium]MDA8305002.1 radical SAM protein [Deltaproteobacteria bacterium]